MDVIVLAAGYATRLYPLTLNTPKPLLEVGSKTIIDRILAEVSQLDNLGTVYVVTNQKFYQTFCDWSGKRSDDGLRIEVINDGTLSNDDRLGAIGDIRFVLSRKNIGDDLLVLGGDNIFEFKLDDFVSFSKSKGEVAAAFYDIKDRAMASLYGVAALDENARVIDFEEKPAEPKSTLISTCVYFFPKDRLNLFDEYFSSGEPKDATGNYIRWVAQNHAVYGYAFDETWYDIGDKESLKVADEDYKVRGKSNNE